MPKERAFSIEETALALKVSEKTILRRIQTGQLKGFRAAATWWVPQKSLRAWIFRAIGISGRRPTYKKSARGGIKTVRFRGQAASASGYRLRDFIDPAAVQGVISVPAAAAVHLQGSFRFLACRLALKNYSLQDDLVQEMTLAVLLCEFPANRSFFLERARSRALNYLEHERLRGMVRLSDMTRQPEAAEPIKDESLLHLLKMAGIPVALIARELGIRISPDVEPDNL